MADIFKDEIIPIDCPECKHVSKLKVSVLERNPRITCPSCKKQIQIKADQLRRAHREVNKALEDLERAFRQIK